MNEVNESRHVYHVIAEELRDRILSGKFGLGDRLPSTTALCKEFGVSNITIRAALKELAGGGYIETRPRSGVFVRNWQQPRKKQKRGIVAFMVESVRSSFFTECIAGVEEVARAAGYHLLVSNSYATAEFEAQHLAELVDEVEGLIIMPVTADGNYAAFVPLLEKKTPFVFVDRYVEKLAAPTITTDNEAGGHQGATHLLDCGCQQVYFLCVRDSTSQRERVKGYQRALRERGVATPASWVRPSTLQNEEAGYESTKKLLAEVRLRERIGIFAINDQVARGAYLAIKEAGLRIPNDVAVVGFDDIDAVYFDPPLTSIHQDLRLMGVMAMKKLVELMESDNEVRSERMLPQLVVRNSTDVNSEFCLTRHINDGVQRAHGAHDAVVTR